MKMSGSMRGALTGMEFSVRLVRSCYLASVSMRLQCATHCLQKGDIFDTP